MGFCYTTCRVTGDLGVSGARNRRDGSVEAMVAGTPDAVEKIVAWARRGPPGAVVTDVRIAEGGGEFPEFGTLPTE